MDRKRKLIKDVIKYIESNYSDSSMNTASIGEHFNLSPYYLSRLFKNEMGISLIDYLNRHRITIAKELMKNSNLSSVDIAEKVGFNHVRTFYRILKKHFVNIDEQ